MAVLKRKNRMISLRLSNEEYESLRNLYRVHGSRSVSEFARNAMQKVIGEAKAPSANLEGRLSDLDTKMNSLDQEVGRLIRLIEERMLKNSMSAVDAA